MPNASLFLPKNSKEAFYKKLDELTLNKTYFKLWAKDKTLFASSDSFMMDWIFEPEESFSNLVKTKNKVDKILAKGFSHVILLGMGGSSLAPFVFSQLFKKQNGFPEFLVLDSIHPDDVFALQNKIDVKKTLFVVSSKSGGTLEPNLLYHHFLSLLQEEGAQEPFAHFVAITDPVSSLEQEAVEKGFLETFFGNPFIGGRFSSSSVFGIVPMLLMGLDVKSILEKNLEAMQDFGPSVLPKDNLAFLLGIFLGINQQAGKDKLKIYLSPSLKTLGLWLEQLIAESLGKDGVGIVPIVSDEFVSKPDVMHCFISLEDENFGENFQKDDDEAKIFFKLSSLEEILAHMFLWEIAISVCGIIMRINPFNQPDVEQSKVLAKKFLKEGVNTKQIFTELKPFLDKIKPHDYVAILAFIEQNDKNATLLKNIKKLLKAKKAEVLLQFGPRYLHSTGQLFKGGGNNGHYLILTSNYKSHFADLMKAHQSQAMGDLTALLNKNKNAILINIEMFNENEQELMDFFRNAL